MESSVKTLQFDMQGPEVIFANPKENNAQRIIKLELIT